MSPGNKKSIFEECRDNDYVHYKPKKEKELKNRYYIKTKNGDVIPVSYPTLEEAIDNAMGGCEIILNGQVVHKIASPIEEEIKEWADAIKTVFSPAGTNHLEKIIENGCNDLRDRLGSKNAEYASPEDVYHNFEEAAKMIPNGTKQIALWNFMVKHLVSLQDIIFKQENEDLIPEKCGDIRAYITLLEGMYD
jgi:hypothetical protein